MNWMVSWLSLIIATLFVLTEILEEEPSSIESLDDPDVQDDNTIGGKIRALQSGSLFVQVRSKFLLPTNKITKNVLTIIQS